MSSLRSRIFGALFLSAALAASTGPVSALTVNFSPDIDLDYSGSSGPGGYEGLAVDFGASIGSTTEHAAGTGNNVWLTNGGGINIGAGFEVVAATLSITTGSNPTSGDVFAVLGDSTGALEHEEFLTPALSTGTTTFNYLFLTPIAAQVSSYDLYFGLKIISGDGVFIDEITLDLALNEASTTTVSAPTATALLGLAMIGITTIRRKRR